ncbi:hypothetical protein BX604_5395 [Burkholderia sp. JKS000303]|nr:hypothetical protein BX604_5395 [Burkholderia sp. JKS000303]
MLARYRKSISKLVTLLRKVQSNPENFDQLLVLQREIVSRIRRTDQRVAELKSLKRELTRGKRGGGLSKADARLIKEEIAAVSGAVRFYQWLLFVWRSFGDSIAFVYLDKFSIKHMIFNVDDGAKKEAAGALAGKEGFEHEWRLVRLMARQGIPAMLCDISNVLRHGDVCILAGLDPIPIEVKASENSNARVERQLENIKKIRDFYETDISFNFRGHERLRRVELPTPKTNHAAVLNKCIELSLETGGMAISPEPGLVYACLRGGDIDDVLSPHLNPSCSVVMLNRAKAEGDWGIYLPFLLSINCSQAIFEFLNGDITLIVSVDVNELKHTYAKHGLHADLTEQGLIVSRLGAQPNKDIFVTTSPGFLSRIFYEFESIDALAGMQKLHIESIEANSLNPALS